MRSLLVKFTLVSSALLPLPVAHSLGTLLGLLIFAIPNRHRRIAAVNISLSYPGMNQKQQRQLLQRSMVELGKSIMEVGPLWRWRKDKIAGLVKQVSGEKYVTEAFDAGRGVILALPHLGAWELVGLYCSAKYPMTSLYRPPKLAQLDGLVRSARERLGASLVPTNATGVRALFTALRNNELIAILPDQDPGNVGNVTAPFFGVQANTMTLLTRLAQKTGAAVIFCHAERLSGGAGFHLHFEDGSTDITNTDAIVAATAMNHDVERSIGNCPAQYQWNYKRFKTRPDGEASPYQF